MIEILELYKQIYDENVSSDDWFPQVRDMAETIGYAKAPKVYKKDPDSYKDMSVMLQALFVLRQQAEEILRTFTKYFKCLVRTK